MAVASRVLVALCLCLTACGARTVLPRPAAGEPTELVYLLKYEGWGHHSIAFHRNGRLTEFTYGDWQLYAHNRRDCWTAWTHMTFFTQGALGRKIVRWNPGEPMRDLFNGYVDHLAFRASSHRVSALYDRLQTAYESELGTETLNSFENVRFVKYDRSYCLFNNCNHAVEDWLEELGAEVSGRVFYEPDFLAGIRPR